MDKEIELIMPLYYIGDKEPFIPEEHPKHGMYILRHKGEAEARGYALLEGFKQPQEMHPSTYSNLAEDVNGNMLWALITEYHNGKEWNRLGFECPFDNPRFQCFDILRFIDPVDDEPVKYMPEDMDGESKAHSNKGIFVLIKKPNIEDYLVPLEYVGKWLSGMYIEKAADTLRLARTLCYQTSEESGNKEVVKMNDMPVFHMSDKD